MSDLNNKGIYRNELLDLLIPDFPEEGNLQMPTPGVLSYYKDRKDRIIWINKDIDDSLFDEIKLILQFNREDEENNIPVENFKITLLSDGTASYKMFNDVYNNGNAENSTGENRLMKVYLNGMLTSVARSTATSEWSINNKNLVINSSNCDIDLYKFYCPFAILKLQQHHIQVFSGLFRS